MFNQLSIWVSFQLSIIFLIGIPITLSFWSFKKRHFKRRVIQPEFINFLSNSLQKGALIFIKTDVKDLFDYMDYIISSSFYFQTIDKKDFNYSESFNPNKVKTNREKYAIVNQLDIFERIYMKI